jgi:hypothetical protein
MGVNNKHSLPSQNQMDTYKKFYQEGLAAGKIAKTIKYCNYENRDCTNPNQSNYTHCPF